MLNLFYFGSRRPLTGKEVVGTFAAGFAIGLALAFMSFGPKNFHVQIKKYELNSDSDYKINNSQKLEIQKNNIVLAELNDNDNEDPHQELDNVLVTVPTFQARQRFAEEDDHWRQDDESVAIKLQDEIRVVCLVMTNSESESLARAFQIQKTWGSKCAKLVFAYSKNDTSFKAERKPRIETAGENNTWVKTKGLFQYAWKNHRHEAKWFLKTDDDTFVVMENLRLFLRDKNPKIPSYHGFRCKNLAKQGYMTEDAGVVLSAEALDRLAMQGFPYKKKCSDSEDGPVDEVLGKCLESMGVPVGDSRDSLGRFRFLPLPLENHIIPDDTSNSSSNYSWFQNATYYHPKQGLDCCSDRAITLHGASAHIIRTLEYMLYHVRPYGISQDRARNITTSKANTHFSPKSGTMSPPVNVTLRPRPISLSPIASGSSIKQLTVEE